MEIYTGLINILLQHGQRFFEIWNFQIIIAVATIGFVMSNEGLAAKDRVRVHITIVFLMIAIFSVYTEAMHHERETLLWNALQERVTLAPSQFTPEDRDYLDALKPRPFVIKAGALVMVDLIVIMITWISPKVKQ
jgi:hypothetical protein